MQRRVTVAAGAAVIAVGKLADAAEQVGASLVAAFCRQQLNVDVVIHEADLGDPTAVLRAGLVDVALTRIPFEANGIPSYVLRSDPIGVVMHDDDPLARREAVAVAVAELTDRRWVRLPDGTDATFRAYWTVHGAIRRPPGHEDHPGMPAIGAVEWDLGTRAAESDTATGPRACAGQR